MHSRTELVLPANTVFLHWGGGGILSFLPWMQELSYLERASFVMTVIMNISVVHHFDNVKLVRVWAPAGTSPCIWLSEKFAHSERTQVFSLPWPCSSGFCFQSSLVLSLSPSYVELFLCLRYCGLLVICPVGFSESQRGFIYLKSPRDWMFWCMSHLSRLILKNRMFLHSVFMGHWHELYFTLISKNCMEIDFKMYVLWDWLLLGWGDIAWQSELAVGF